MMIREMVGDGFYYPSQPEELRTQIQRALREVRTTRGNARVTVVPYGAYQFTLPYLADSMKSYGAVAPERVLVIAPADSDSSQRLLLPESEAFSTPFGTLPVDQESLAVLRQDSSLFVDDEIAHLQNHSLEVLLPPLHYLLGPVPIVPVLVGRLNPEQLRRATESLERVRALGEHVTLAGANLSGFVSPLEADARARKLIRLIMTGAGHDILERIDTFESPPRSLSSLVLAHLLAGPDTRPEILGRGTFETEYEGDVGSVLCASIAYLPV